jgi:hypothetical protein
VRYFLLASADVARTMQADSGRDATLQRRGVVGRVITSRAEPARVDGNVAIANPPASRAGDGKADGAAEGMVDHVEGAVSPGNAGVPSRWRGDDRRRSLEMKSSRMEYWRRLSDFSEGVVASTEARRAMCSGRCWHQGRSTCARSVGALHKTH